MDLSHFATYHLCIKQLQCIFVSIMLVATKFQLNNIENANFTCQWIDVQMDST